MVETTLEQKLLNEIADQAGMFNSNSIFQMCCDGCSFVSIITTLSRLIQENKIVELWYCPYEERTASEKIGNDSYNVYIIKHPKLNVNKLMN